MSVNPFCRLNYPLRQIFQMPQKQALHELAGLRRLFVLFFTRWSIRIGAA